VLRTCLDLLQGKAKNNLWETPAAVRSAINNTGKIILKDYIEHCIIEAVNKGDKEAVDMLSAAIDRFMN